MSKWALKILWLPILLGLAVKLAALMVWWAFLAWGEWKRDYPPQVRAQYPLRNYIRFRLTTRFVAFHLNRLIKSGQVEVL